MGAYTHVHGYAIKSNEMCCIENIFTNLQTFRYVRDWTTKWTTKIKVIQTDKSADNRKWQYFCLIKWGSININSDYHFPCILTDTHSILQASWNTPTAETTSPITRCLFPVPISFFASSMTSTELQVREKTNKHACMFGHRWMTNATGCSCVDCPDTHLSAAAADDDEHGFSSALKESQFRLEFRNPKQTLTSFWGTATVDTPNFPCRLTYFKLLASSYCC